jgi:hypothetical protein
MKSAASNELIEVAQESKVHKTKLIQSTVEIQSRPLESRLPEFDRGLAFFVNTIHGYLYNYRINRGKYKIVRGWSIRDLSSNLDSMTQTQKKKMDTHCNNVMIKRLFFFFQGKLALGDVREETNLRRQHTSNPIPISWPRL